jgi:hypothetical protein
MAYQTELVKLLKQIAQDLRWLRKRAEGVDRAKEQERAQDLVDEQVARLRSRKLPY